ncbi:MAG UNVERIFIED_CONTAM: chromate transporter [Planctomycetaceae bacterium]|jgi:hypothetical protein
MNQQPPTSPAGVSFADAVRLWLRVGLLSFGGPAAQIAVMHRLVVDERRWVDEQKFLNGLNFCMLLPGPEAQQLATWLGWTLHGLRGGLAAGLLFILPGSLCMLVLGWIYTEYRELPALAGLFFGLKCGRTRGPCGCPATTNTSSAQKSLSAMACGSHLSDDAGCQSAVPAGGGNGRLCGLVCWTTWKCSSSSG